MKWSLSEFLNLIELRSQTWCFVDLGTSSGFGVPHNDAIFFYAALSGRAKIAGVGGPPLVLEEGEVVMILSGEAHALRTQSESPSPVLEFLSSGDYVDAPASFSRGTGGLASRLLCGRLKVRWPGGQQPAALPAALRIGAERELVNFPRLVEAANGSGASAVFTRLATLLFVQAFRDHPQCQEAFRESTLHNPIARARQFISTHPFRKWSVAALAMKVGMGRSNFATRFHAEIGRTPMELLTEERMKHAAIFLEQTSLKIAEIGERVGYRSEAAFSNRFIAQYGMTPGQMRKLSRQGHLDHTALRGVSRIASPREPAPVLTD